MLEILSDLNYLAIFVTAVAYWLLGSLWFMVLFKKVWTCPTEKCCSSDKACCSSDKACSSDKSCSSDKECKMEASEKKVFIWKMIATFILNLIVVFGVAIMVYALDIPNLGSAIILGLILGICFAAAPMRTSSIWSNRSCTLALIDVGYPVVAIIMSSIILSYWT